MAADALGARHSPLGQGLKFTKELAGPEAFERVPLGITCFRSAGWTGQDKAVSNPGTTHREVESHPLRQSIQGREPISSTNQHCECRPH